MREVVGSTLLQTRSFSLECLGLLSLKVSLILPSHNRITSCRLAAIIALADCQSIHLSFLIEYVLRHTLTMLQLLTFVRTLVRQLIFCLGMFVPLLVLRIAIFVLLQLNASIVRWAIFCALTICVTVFVLKVLSLTLVQEAADYAIKLIFCAKIVLILTIVLSAWKATFCLMQEIA